MDSVVCNKVQPVVRKVKKKQVKGELDRLKQAEKKKRRLEKALANSEAIRFELEKKKQKKKEEQQRLDEEGAAIAEAVALQVLLGEDSNDSCKILLNEEGFKRWECDGKLDLFMGNFSPCLPQGGYSRYELERIGWVSNPYSNGFNCREAGNTDSPFSSGSLGRDTHASYFAGEAWGTTNFSAGLLAAQAVSSLQIAEDAPVDTIVVNGLLRQ